MIVDESTGEVFSYNDKYEVGEYTHNTQETPILFLEGVSSVDDMQKFMSVMVDKRKIRKSNSNDLLRFFESCLGYKALDHELFGDKEVMTIPQYRLLERLGPLVKYKNVIMTTREELCTTLNCRDKDFSRVMKTISGYVKVFTQRDGIRRGEVKVLVHPAFFYTYSYSLYDKSRKEAIADWYRLPALS